MPSISSEISLKISNLLKTMGKISEDSIIEAKKKHEGNGEVPLGILHYLLEDKKITEDDVVAAISRNYALRKIQLTEQTVKKDALAKFPSDFIEENEIIPFEIVGKILKVAIFDPAKSTLASKMKSMTGCNIELYVAKPSNIEQAKTFKTVVEALSAPSNSETKLAPAQKKTVQNIKIPSARTGEKEDTNHVISFANSILLDAFDNGISDIHIEPYRFNSRVRYRLDGMLQEQESDPEVILKDGTSIKTKIIAGCDISEKRLPQDGKLKFKNPRPLNDDDIDIDVRFSVIPAKEGERVVMRILSAGPDLGLEQIGLEKQDYENLISAISAPQGMVLVTGPTGSGKSILFNWLYKKN